MRAVSTTTFGYLIAYVIPGFLVIASLSGHSPTLQAWLAPAADAPSVGGFLYVTIASVTAGMAVSAIRWLVIDTIHHRTGVPRPAWDLSRLPTSMTAFDTLVEHHYRHYQAYGNSLVAITISLINPRALSSILPVPTGVGVLLLLVFGILCYVASRDALRKYYDRTNLVLHVDSFPRPQKECSDGKRLPPR